MNIRVWAKTDVGKKRDHNEDSHLVDEDLGLYLVADGMGGHMAGETASKIAVNAISRFLRDARDKTPEAPDASESSETKPRGTMLMFASMDPEVELLGDAVRAASTAILDAQFDKPELAGMGTTVSLLYFTGDRAYYAHVGDSRIYRLSGDTMTQITTDHSLVQEQLDAGYITAQQAETHRLRNVITRSVGFDPNVTVDAGSVTVKPGDRFLLCSDGLSNPVKTAELKEMLQKKEPEQILEIAISLANNRGGDDNITGIVLEILPETED